MLLFSVQSLLFIQAQIVLVCVTLNFLRPRAGTLTQLLHDLVTSISLSRSIFLSSYTHMYRDSTFTYSEADNAVGRVNCDAKHGIFPSCISRYNIIRKG